MKPSTSNNPIRFFSLICLFAVSAGISHISSASGGSGGFYNEPEQARPVDHTYEAGKAIFKGRNQNYKPHTFCIADTTTGEVKKLKRSSVKPYKKQTATHFASNLYSCQEPSKHAYNILSSNDLSFLVYYLNKRFSLRLSQ